MSQKPSEDYPLTFLGGAFFGFLIGGLLALWYAPQSGAQTLAGLREWFGLRGQQARLVVERLQGETIAQSLEKGRALAHQHRARHAGRLPDSS